MSISSPNFAQYLNDILEYGPYDTATEAAMGIGISKAHFSMIHRGARKRPVWENGAKIIREHIRVMEAVNHG
jgi:hypothetical protein